MATAKPRNLFLYSSAYVLLIKDGKVYMQRRRNTGWQDGNYGIPAGHIEDKESPLTAAAREALEEAGIKIHERDLRFVHSMYRMSPDRTYADYFFMASKWEGEPAIGEPDLCDEDNWFSLESLPDNVIPSVKAVIEHYKKAESFSVFQGN